MNDSLQTSPIHKLLLKYCIPAIVSMMTVSLYNTVDRVFIGHIPDIGSLALTSLGTVMPFITIILACELLITYGAIANLSIKLGEKNQLMAEKILNQVPGLGVMISLLLMIIFFIFKTPLLELFGANKIILPLASEYLNVMILGIPFYIIGFSLMATIRSEGNPKRAALILIMSCVINIVLDPIFIFGLGLGIKGAAIATVLSYLAVFIYVFYYYSIGKSNLKLKWTYLKPELSLIKPILLFGLSTSLVQLITALIQVLFNRSLAYYGTPLSIGAFTTVTTITNLALMPAVGINQGSVLLPSTTEGLKLYLFSLPLCALTTTAPNFFQAIGQSKLSIWLVILRQIILLIPLILILPKFIGLNGVWLAQPITDLMIAIISFYLIRKEFKRYSSV